MLPQICFAQDELTQYRNNYLSEHLQEDHSPINYENIRHIRFFPLNEELSIEADVELVKDKKGFSMQTHSGDERTYFKYAKLIFELEGEEQILYLYQSKRLLKSEEYADYLFLPFTDDTNYKTTFGGGRYLDFKIDDIQGGQLAIDFNKAYNPYCAYAGGFSCAIPPKENNLKVEIIAGEANFAVEPKH